MDTIALTDAVQVAIDFAAEHPDETLIIVTGDHETGGMTIGFAATAYDTHFDYLAKPDDELRGLQYRRLSSSGMRKRRHLRQDALAESSRPTTA